MSEPTTTIQDYGVRDELGRRVCGVCMIWRCDDGTFVVRVGAGRDGQWFGKVTPVQYAANMTEVEALIAKKTAAARKRFVRKFGKGAAL